MNEDVTPVEALSFEDALAELEQIVSRLESGQGSLNDAIEAYERGSILKRHCQGKLEEARMRVEKIRLPDGESAASDPDF